MRLVDYLDKGAQLGGEAPCLTMGDTDLSYAEVQAMGGKRWDTSSLIARLDRD